MPWYCAQHHFFPTVCASNQAEIVTHRALKASIEAELDALKALGED